MQLLYRVWIRLNLSNSPVSYILKMCRVVGRPLKLPRVITAVADDGIYQLKFNFRSLDLFILPGAASSRLVGEDRRRHRQLPSGDN